MSMLAAIRNDTLVTLHRLVLVVAALWKLRFTITGMLSRASAIALSLGTFIASFATTSISPLVGLASGILACVLLVIW